MLLRHDILTHRRLADVYRYLVMVGNVAQSGAENVYLLFVLLEFLFLLYVLVVLLDKNSHDAQPKISRVTPAKPMTPSFGCQVAGVFEGDEIVSVNGEPAASPDAQGPRVLGLLQMEWQRQIATC